jgi:hypothetical protein
MYKFSPACENETIVFGASRPGYSNHQVAAIAAVFQGKNPWQVVKNLDTLLNDCRLAVSRTQ